MDAARFTLDVRYPGIIDATATAMRDAAPEHAVKVLRHGRDACMFCEYCERLGVRWTQSNARNISVSHLAGVAILDDFIGPKS